MTSFGTELAEARHGNNGTGPVPAMGAVLSPAPDSYPPDAQLWLVLGEDAAEAGRALGLTTIISVPRPVAYAGRTDWVEQLRGRTIHGLVMDCDGPGRAAAERIAAALATIATVRCPLDLDTGRDDAYNLSGWLAEAEADDGPGVESARVALLQAADNQPLIEPDSSTDDPAPVKGAALLDGIATTIKRFMVLQRECEADALALFVVHTYAIDYAYQTPYVVINSPELECGKSRLLEVLALLVHKADTFSDASAAVLYRLIELNQPTILYDEIDQMFASKNESDQAMVKVLNAGNRRNAKVRRMVGRTS